MLRLRAPGTPKHPWRRVLPKASFFTSERPHLPRCGRGDAKGTLGAVKYDRLWERLIEYVNEWGSAREVPGGFEVTFEQQSGVTRTV
jgi:hypothetical protein